MKLTTGQSRSGFTLVELLVVISIIVVLASLAVPTAARALAKAEAVTAINNVKNVKAALDLFAQDFDGEYPNDDTAEELADILDDNDTGSAGGNRAGLGSSDGVDGGRRLQRDRGGRGGRGDSRASASNSKPSNFYFQQMMTRGLDDEKLLYLKSFKKAFKLTKPNNDKKVDQGECVWGYTKNLQQTSSGNIPVVFDSPVSGGESPKFSKKPWDGKVIIARLDNSTKTELIGGSDKLTGIVKGKIDGDRVNIFAPENLEEGELVPADLKRIGSNN